MHPDLSSNLHTPECNKLIEALLQCHKENRFKRFLGVCNDANSIMLKCLKAERIQRRKENFDKSMEKRERLFGHPKPSSAMIKKLSFKRSWLTLTRIFFRIYTTVGDSSLTSSTISKMEDTQDIEDEYLSQGSAYETLTERSFGRFYFIEPNGGGHYRLLAHSNKICLITLAPSHPIITNDLVVSTINYQANDNCNRMNNKVSGKRKAGAQFLTDCSILCSIKCEGREEPFIVRSNLVAKLIEMNKDISETPNLLKNCEKGYIAIVFPKLHEFDREIRRWMTEEEYLLKIKSDNVD
ncbi:Protein Simiate [Orchesella cincta]|uniref:Protein Simiate n=1 Tax=Orchesella cincta TaxID=48709 RepID=A0A1D2N7Z5_ORCCI|nr:Protein Simiate [Orchesella cincta]